MHGFCTEKAAQNLLEIVLLQELFREGKETAGVQLGVGTSVPTKRKLPHLSYDVNHFKNRETLARRASGGVFSAHPKKNSFRVCPFYSTRKCTYILQDFHFRSRAGTLVWCIVGGFFVERENVKIS